MRQKVTEGDHAEEGNGVSQKRNIYHRLEMGVKNEDTGQLAGAVGSRASLVDGGRSELSNDSQPTLCFRNCSVSSRTEHLYSMPLLHHGFLSMIKVNIYTAIVSI